MQDLNKKYVDPDFTCEEDDIIEEPLHNYDIK